MEEELKKIHSAAIKAINRIYDAIRDGCREVKIEIGGGDAYKLCYALAFGWIDGPVGVLEMTDYDDDPGGTTLRIRDGLTDNDMEHLQRVLEEHRQRLEELE